MSEREAWHVARTLRALEALALGPHSAVEISDILLIHPRTARRLLDRLVDEGYVTRSADPPRKYVSTLRLVALAGRVVENAEVVQAAEPYLRKAAEETGAVAHIAVPSLTGVLCVLHAEPGGQPPVPSLGERIPAHATAAGKALLAFRDGWRGHVLAQPLEPFTARTITAPGPLETELRKVRGRGHAIENGEYRPDQGGIAAPVFSHTCEAVAAFGISGPSSRFSGSRRRKLGELVVELAATVSKDIGYSSGQHPADASAADG